MGRWARWVLGVVSLALLFVAIMRELQFVVLGALATLLIALAPVMFEGLMLRLRRFGPAEFDAAAVKDALAGIPEQVRAKAEREAEARIHRLGAKMGDLPRLLNAIVAEVAALGVRVTAIEEEIAALRARIR